MSLCPLYILHILYLHMSIIRSCNIIVLKVGSSYVVLIVPRPEKSNDPSEVEHLQLLSMLQAIPSDCLTSRARTTKTFS